ncbi:IS3 family transposase [Epibacterium sp. SM1969]|uniref:IS3 family transposase n=1 Tax=Tritonibacter aquimaris TaxID=2663379 RepID=A0A844AT63_9RHOB|nr:IS3 family transposase [Tritonibacter aquimaris]
MARMIGAGLIFSLCADLEMCTQGASTCLRLRACSKTDAKNVAPFSGSQMVLASALGKHGRKRKAVVHLMEAHQVSQRRACKVLQIDRSSARYLSLRGDDAELRDAIKRVSRERRRFGCRRVQVMVTREGFAVNHKKVRRIYIEETLQVPHRGGRKRALGTRKPMVVPDGPNQRWSLNFVSDALADARRFRILAVVDDFNREDLVLVADTSLSGQPVARELDRSISERGMPKTIVSDNCTEFASMAILKWVQDTCIDWHY